MDLILIVTFEEFNMKGVISSSIPFVPHCHPSQNFGLLLVAYCYCWTTFISLKKIHPFESHMFSNVSKKVK